MDQDVLDAVRLLRGHLRELVEARRVAVLDGRLAGVLSLAEQDSEAALPELAGVLSGEPELENWVARVLEDPHKRPPALQARSERAPDRLPGTGEPVPALRYECPLGDYAWYRLTVGERVRKCPTHRLLLVAASG
ncbi:hypothetical protein ACFV16_12605 [Streptomyces massasporeus]|uniref:hypothetical protein n=1 Tax=Streptomyces massasporeus TaxID=67324 RepID=UPI00368DF3C2